MLNQFLMLSPCAANSEVAIPLQRPRSALRLCPPETLWQELWKKPTPTLLGDLNASGSSTQKSALLGMCPEKPHPSRPGLLPTELSGLVKRQSNCGLFSPRLTESWN